MVTKVTPSVLADTAVTAGTYGGATSAAVVTIDAQGRITYAANATPSYSANQLTGFITSSQITNVANTQVTGLINSGQLANTAVTAGTYGGSSAIPVIIINPQGQVTSAANASISIPSPILDNLATSYANTSTTAINLSSGGNASVYKLFINSSTTLTFQNSPATANTVYSFTLITTNITAGAALSFGNTIKWAGGSTPPRTTALNGTDIWTFFIDGSTGTYYGSLSILNAS
jgi:hypothetical protein